MPLKAAKQKLIVWAGGGEALLRKHITSVKAIIFHTLAT